jgi:hypothetical protein
MKQYNFLSKTIFLSLTFLIISCMSFAQSEERSISGVEKISYSLAGKLIIEQGNSETLILKGNSEDIQEIITRMDGGNLRIYTKKGCQRLGDVEVYVTIKKLNELSVAGSGDVIIKTELNSEEFELNLSGSGNIKASAVTAEEIGIDLAGSGDIDMGGGSSEELEINIAGSGDVNTSAHKSQEVDVNIAGSGNAKVWAEEELDVSIVGSGDVYYKGRPMVDASSSGSGSTRPL